MSSPLISNWRICSRKTWKGDFVGRQAALFHRLGISGMLFTILSLDGIVPQAISESLKGQIQYGVSEGRLIEVREKVFLPCIFMYFFTDGSH